MKNSEIYERFCKAIDATINGWRVADRITELERRDHIQQIIYGITTSALYVLPEPEYHELVNYIHEKGFNH